MEIEWNYYNKNEIITNKKNSEKINKHLEKVIDIFNKNLILFSSEHNKLRSNEVLEKISELEKIGYQVEKTKKISDSIMILKYENKETYKEYETLFRVDAFNLEERTVIEVEAGRAYDNNQFLKDFFEACVCNKVDFIVIAVRKNYRGNNDFHKVSKYFDLLYKSDIKSSIPLEGVLLIGY